MAGIEPERIYAYGGVVDLHKGADGMRALGGNTESEANYVSSNRTRESLMFLPTDETGRVARQPATAF